VKHYLIGNNRIGENDVGDCRVMALARLIQCRPDIITWYLAGNELNERTITFIAEALIHTKAKYVWFKMNPIKTGAFHLGRTLQLNPHIELLDLFNCGLCNDGVQALADGLRCGNEITRIRTNIKHLYLPINAVDDVNGLKDILELIGFQLESLYIGVNPLGDEQVIELIDFLIQGNVSKMTALKRLSMGSVGVTDAVLPSIEAFVRATTSLVSLDLGSYRSTDYFNEQHNNFGDVDALIRLALLLKGNATKSKQLDDCCDPSSYHFLGLQDALSASANDIACMERTLNAEKINANLIQRKKRAAEDHAGSFLIASGVSPSDMNKVTNPYPAVRYIYSIYRNNM
jgi:hypothetical protein